MYSCLTSLLCLHQFVELLVFGYTSVQKPDGVVQLLPECLHLSRYFLSSPGSDPVVYLVLLEYLEVLVGSLHLR